jgi:hypothetical protein
MELTMKRFRTILLVLALLTPGSALAYDSFTVGVQGELAIFHMGFNMHAVMPIATTLVDTTPVSLSLRADFTAGGALAFAGLSATVSFGNYFQPFVSLGGGALWPDWQPAKPAFQALLGMRFDVTHNFYMVAQAMVRTFDGAGMPGVGVAVEYSF